MEWLSQNWVWLALGAGVLLVMMRRGGQGSCCGGAGHGKSDKRPESEGTQNQASVGSHAEHQH